MSNSPEIFVAIGANLPSREHGPPLATCRAALPAMVRAGIRILACARWYRSDAVPASDQPPYVNGVVRIATTLEPAPLLAALHTIEHGFGRIRRDRNAARPLDLDLIAYGERVDPTADGPILPHPRMHERAFVLLPLADLSPQWRHPRLGVRVQDLIAALPDIAGVVPIAASDRTCATSGGHL